MQTFGYYNDDDMSTSSSTSQHLQTPPQHLGREDTFQYRSAVGSSKEDIENVFLITEEEDDSMYRLDNFNSALILTIMEDIIQSLRIIDYCNNSMRIQKTLIDLPKLRAQKYNIDPDYAGIDDLTKIEEAHLTKSEYKINKVFADRDYMLEVITSLYYDLAGKKSFKVLQDRLDTFVAKKEHTAHLEKEIAVNRAKYREQAKMIRSMRNSNKRATFDIDEEIDRLRSEKEDPELSMATQSRYVVKWQNARSECHAINIENQEATFDDNIKLYKEKSLAEIRVHQEIDTFNIVIISDKLAQTEDVMDKYDHDIGVIDLKLQKMTVDYDNLVDYRKALEEKIEKHRNAIKAWLNFTEARRKDLEYKRRMNVTASIIQAWWRGILVRRELGPYKLKKKGASKKSQQAKEIA